MQTITLDEIESVIKEMQEELSFGNWEILQYGRKLLQETLNRIKLCKN